MDLGGWVVVDYEAKKTEMTSHAHAVLSEISADLLLPLQFSLLVSL